LTKEKNKFTSAAIAAFILRLPINILVIGA